MLMRGHEYLPLECTVNTSGREVGLSFNLKFESVGDIMVERGCAAGGEKRMHEFSITQELVKVVDEARRGAAEDARVLKVVVRLGKFTAAVPECMEYYYKLLTENTLMAGAELEFIEVPVELFCGDCRKTFGAEAAQFLCPECGGSNTEITAGRDLIVETIEVEDPNGDSE
jgi:hydrogenase nickel incorporation protein HypA/HybF